MKKKFILVVLVLLVALVALTACGQFIIPNSESNVTPADKSDSELKNELSNPSTTAKEPTLSVVGKTFVFDIAAVEFNTLIYPNVDNAQNDSIGIDNDAKLMMEEIQMFVNELYLAYNGSKLIFQEDGIATQVFADGSQQSYEYEESKTFLQQTMTVYIGTMGDNGKFTIELEGVADTDTLLLSIALDEDKTNFGYLQFIVQTE